MGFDRKQYDRQRYLDNREAVIARKVTRQRELLEWSRDLKRNPCTDCGGEFHPVAMQWDHVGDDKEADVAKLLKNGCGKERILREIAKCELVCANCHAVRTLDRRGVAE